MIKQKIKAFADRYRVIGVCYVACREKYHQLRKLGYFITDFAATYRDMSWASTKPVTYWSLSAQLLFQYHKLEKGLCMPGKRRFFGYDPAKATLALLHQWKAMGFSEKDGLYIGAVATLHAYQRRLDELQPPNVEALKQALQQFLLANAEDNRYATPYENAEVEDVARFDQFKRLALARRSVRDYLDIEIPPDVLSSAIELAQLSPSACNRQPCRVHVYTQKRQIEKLLALQNGNRGFGQTISTLMVITAEASGFFDASERNEPYIDGGLFSMSLILALKAQGVSSCCLNWCVSPAEDKSAHELGKIASSERIIMFMAVGYASDTAVVPRSPRRDLETVMQLH